MNKVDPTRDRCSPRTKRRLHRWGVTVAIVLVFGVFFALFAYLNRDRLLIGMAKAWEVNDSVTKADAIVVLGGGIDTRPEAAANLYQAGVAPLILYMNVMEPPAAKLGITLSEPEETRRILLSNGVPASAMELIGTNVASTFDESRAVRAWQLSRHAQSIVIVTDIFHTRRARWIFRKELKGSGLQIHIKGEPTLEYNATNWWRHEGGVVDFQNELVKTMYYRFAH